MCGGGHKAVFSSLIIPYASCWCWCVSLQILAPVKMADVVQPDPNSLQIPSETHIQFIHMLHYHGSLVKMTHFCLFIFWRVNTLTFPCHSPTWEYYLHHFPVTFLSFQFITNIQSTSLASRELTIRCLLHV